MAREKNWAEEAAKAMADLHMFSAVQVLMESSLISTPAHADERRINQIAQLAQSKALSRYDEALANLKAQPHDR